MWDTIKDIATEFVNNTGLSIVRAIAFFVLGLGASAAGSFFGEHRMLFARIGGVLIILFGLYQIGVFGSSSVLGAVLYLAYSSCRTRASSFCPNPCRISSSYSSS